MRHITAEDYRMVKRDDMGRIVIPEPMWPVIFARSSKRKVFDAIVPYTSVFINNEQVDEAEDASTKTVKPAKRARSKVMTRSVTAARAKKEKGSPLLDLAPELRNYIYKLAMPDADDSRANFAFELQIPSVCQINRTTRDEALSILIGSRNHVVSIAHPADLFRTIHWLCLAKTAFPGRMQQFELHIPRVVKVSFNAIPDAPCMLVLHSDTQEPCCSPQALMRWGVHYTSYAKVKYDLEIISKRIQRNPKTGITVAHIAEVLRLVCRDDAFDYNNDMVHVPRQPGTPNPALRALRSLYISNPSGM